MLAVTGGKGGSGKTTTALCLARALAGQGRDPVVVDCDSDMPDLHHYAGVERTGGVDDVAGGISIRRAATTTTTLPGVRLLTAGARESVEPALRRARRWHGPVIGDCPPGTGPDATVPLRAADRALIVATDRPQSLADAATTAACARTLDAAPVGAVVRRTDPANSPTWADETPILAEVGAVDLPLESPGVAATWEKLSVQIMKTETDRTEDFAEKIR